MIWDPVSKKYRKRPMQTSLYDKEGPNKATDLYIYIEGIYLQNAPKKTVHCLKEIYPKETYYTLKTKNDKFLT